MAVQASLTARIAMRPALSRRRLQVRAHEEETILPLLRLPKQEFTKKDLEQLSHPHLLGGKTIGEELSIIRQKYLEAEKAAIEKEAHLVSDNWDGDVYTGSNLNTLSVLYGIFFFTPIFGLLFAFLSYGKLWGVADYAVMPPLF